MKSEVRAATAPDELVVHHVSPSSYVTVWYFALGIRFLCCAFLTLTAATYFFVAQPRMSFYASMLESSGEASKLASVGYAFEVIAATHAFDLASMLWFSAWHRELLYEPRRNGEAHGTFLWILSSCWRDANKIEPQNASRDCCCLFKKQTSGREKVQSAAQDGRFSKKILRVLKRLWGQGFSRHGFFGVESEYFELQFAAREILEIVAQSVQAYSSSMLVANPWINSLYVGMVVLNCWSAPIVSYLCRRADQRVRKRRRSQAVSRVSSSCAFEDSSNAALQSALLFERIWCLAVELFLDAGAAMLIPTIIFYPYARMFDVHLGEFPVESEYDDVWAVKSVMAAQQFFVLTPYDFVFTLAPHVGIYFGLGALISLSDTRVVAPKKQTIPTICARCTLQKASSKLKITESRNSSGPTRRILSRQLTRMGSVRITSARIDTTAKTLFHFFFAFWGTVVLFLHLGSFISYTVEHDGCSQRVWPWVMHKLPCSVFEYNCYLQNTSTVPKNAFKELESRVLSALLFTHCPALVIPASVSSFTNLMGFGIYNSTIVGWSDEAAITQSRHPSMKYLYLVRTNMSTFPDGLMQQLPHGLVDFEIAVSNLSAFPDELLSTWGRSLSVLYLEQCAFTEFPRALTHLDAKDMSLYGNPIASMASVEFDSDFRMLATLVLANMPLSDLSPMKPENIGKLEWVSLENTRMRELPSWVYAAAAVRTTTTVFAFGTPFCDSQSPESIAAKYGEAAAITCAKPSKFVGGRFPLDLVTRMRSI